MISIAMATYNGALYLNEQLDSILNQTIQDFEIIVCDDCSNDKTIEILEEYKLKDNRIKIFINEENLGYKKNFQKAISLSKGEYIALCDQDDIWLPNHLEVLLNNIKCYDICCGNPELIDKNGNTMGMTFSQYRGFFKYYGSSKFLYRILCDSNPCQGASMLIKRSFFDDSAVLNVPDSVKVHDIWYAICACLKNGMIFTFEVITRYRQHDCNATKNSFNNKKSFRRKIKAALKKLRAKDYDTNRINVIAAIQRLLVLSDEQKEIVQDCLCFHQGRCSNRTSKERLLAAKVYWNNYKYIN